MTFHMTYEKDNKILINESLNSDVELKEVDSYFGFKNTLNLK